MTREEAIKRIQDFIGWFKKDKPLYKALEMAIQALKKENIYDDKEHYVTISKALYDKLNIDYEQALSQEPCDDAISRQAVIERLKKEDKILYTPTGLNYLIRAIEGLSPVTQKCDKCAMNGSGSKYCDNCGQKSGKWIKVKSGNKDFPESIVCSRCSNENSHLDFNENAEPIGKVFVTSKFCPNCGAKMESEG